MDNLDKNKRSCLMAKIKQKKYGARDYRSTFFIF